MSLLSGYGTASLEKKSSDYEVIPFLPQFGFDINPLAEKLSIKPRGTFEFLVEPLVNVVINPDTNAEVGCSFLLKYSGKITSRIAPYVEGGLGMIYTTQHTHEQGTQFNFTSQAGIGLQFFVNDCWALTGGYRVRHMSNADIDDDNSGIDHHFALIGMSYFF
jgi:opacity protein-like surface antigen